MKIIFAYPHNNSPKPENIVFGAGLTREIGREMRNVNVLEISDRLTQKGIPTDFKGNKVIAWCSAKTIEVFQQLNKNFQTHLALPKGIYVEDFAGLNVDSQTMPGFCNLQPVKLIKGSSEIIPSRTVFFNTFETAKKQLPPEAQWLFDWNYINEIADVNYAAKQSSTGHFLYFFMHELSHVAHEDRLLNKLGGQALAKRIEFVKNAKQIEEYQKKYGHKISQICKYALTDQFEAIGCDIPKRIANILDNGTLIPIKNPFLGTPYERLSLRQRINIPFYSDEERPLDEILRNFWNGKFK